MGGKLGGTAQFKKSFQQLSHMISPTLEPSPFRRRMQHVAVAPSPFQPSPSYPWAGTRACDKPANQGARFLIETTCASDCRPASHPLETDPFPVVRYTLSARDGATSGQVRRKRCRDKAGYHGWHQRTGSGPGRDRNGPRQFPGVRPHAPLRQPDPKMTMTTVCRPRR